MKENPLSIPSGVSLKSLIEDYFYQTASRVYPVVQGNQLVGCVDLEAVTEYPRQEWEGHTVDEIMESCSGENTIDPDEDLMQALRKINRSGRTQLLVVKDNRLLGVLSFKDIFQFMNQQSKMEEKPAL